MIGQEYRAALTQLGLSHRKASALLQIRKRKSRRIAAGLETLPQPAADLLRQMLAGSSQPRLSGGH